MKTLHLDEVDSTNDYVKRHLDDLPETALVTAGHQKAGRGRRNRLWQSGKDQNLLGTFLYKGKAKGSFHALVQASLALVSVLKTFDVDAAIKLPNDIVSNGKKIAGILIEQIHGEHPAVLIGIGLNVNQSPPIKSGISMRDILGRQTKIDEVSQELKDAMGSLRPVSFSELFPRFKALLSKNHMEGVYKGKGCVVKDIDENFQCLVESKWVPCQEVSFKLIE